MWGVILQTLEIQINIKAIIYLLQELTYALEENINLFGRVDNIFNKKYADRADYALVVNDISLVDQGLYFSACRLHFKSLSRVYEYT